jgi:hypothetical protein
MYLITRTRCGISAKHLERELGVTYKTAWRMFNKIRNPLMNEDHEPLAGEVEADEMFVGGKLRESERRTLRAQGIANRGPASKKRAVAFGAVEPVAAFAQRSSEGRGTRPPLVEHSASSSCPRRWCSPTIGAGTTR